MKRPAFTIGLLIAVIVILSVVKIFVSNSILTSGNALGDVEDKINTYKIENTLLSEKLYSLSSLTSISASAEDLGFVEEKARFVLVNPVPIALKQ